MSRQQRFTDLVNRLRGISKIAPYARRVGVTRPTMQRWCEGKGTPTDRTFRRFLAAERIDEQAIEAYLSGEMEIEDLLARREGKEIRRSDRINLASVRAWMQSLSVDDLVQIMQEAIALISHRWRSSGRGRSIRELVAQNRERSLQCLPLEDVERLIQGQCPQMHQLIKLSRVLEGFSSEDLLAIAEEEFGEIGKPVEEEKETNGHCI